MSFTLTTVAGGPTVGGVAAAGPALEGGPATVTVAASHPEGDALTYAFDWDGDGTYEASGPAAQASHVFADDGAFTGSLTATDGVQSATAAFVVFVLAWKAIVLIGGLPPFILPSPETVGERQPQRRRARAGSADDMESGHGSSSPWS